VASAHNTSTTLKLTAMTVKSHPFTNTISGLQETDLNSAGKTIGFDEMYITITGKSSGTANVTFDITGGFLYGAVTATNAGKTFKGATGTITAKAMSSNKTAVTIIYSEEHGSLPRAGNIWPGDQGE
jgi:hypothetical protein